MQTQAPGTVVPTRQVICEQSDDPAFRVWVYEQWMALWAQGQAAFSDINNSPYYSQGWRVD